MYAKTIVDLFVPFDSEEIDHEDKYLFAWRATWWSGLNLLLPRTVTFFWF